MTTRDVLACLVLAWGLKLSEGVLAADAVEGSDAFASRPLLGADAFATGDLRAATSEPGEPSLPGYARGQTLWWRWVAPADGRARVAVSTNGFTPMVVLLRGQELAALQPAASNTVVLQSLCFGERISVRPAVTLDVEAGEELALVADWTEALPGGEPGTGGGGPFVLGISFASPPANDDLAGAESLSGLALTARARLSAATQEPEEPAHAGDPGGRSVWFTWTAPVSGQVEITPGTARVYPTPATRPGALAWSSHEELSRSWSLLAEHWSLPPGYGSVFTRLDPEVIDICAFVERGRAGPFVPVFAAYAGTEGPLAPIAGGTNLSFHVEAADSFRLAVAGQAETAEDLDFQLRLTPAAANLGFDERLRLPEASAEAIGHTVGSGGTSGGVPGTGYHNQPATWWTWRAPSEGPVWISTVISDRPVRYRVFTGADLTQVQEVTSGETSVTFQAQPGTEYQVSTTIADAPGELRFSLRHLPARLRAALVTGAGTARGLLVPGEDAPRILVQLADGLRWRDWGFVPIAPPASGVLAWFIPTGTVPVPPGTPPVEPGRARVWFLDFPLPALRLQRPHLPSSPGEPGFLDAVGVPGQTVGFEFSEDLRRWSPLGLITMHAFGGDVPEVFPPIEGGRFYRVREAFPLSARRVLLEGP